MNKKSNKTTNIIFSILSFILKKRTFSIVELSDYLDEKAIYVEQETILKYIRTIKALGFKFTKTNNKIYVLSDIPFKLNTLKEDEDAISDIVNVSNKLYPDAKNNIREKILCLIPQTSKENLCKKQDSITVDTNNQLLEKYEKCCKDAQRLKLFLMDGSAIIAEPHKLLSEKEESFLQCYNVTKNKKEIINLKNIHVALQLPVKNKFPFFENEAVIELSSRFANVYELKDGEIVIGKEKGALLVKTNYYDKESFFKKVLKYMDNCKIVSPEGLKQDFYEYVKDLYQIYDCND